MSQDGPIEPPITVCFTWNIPQEIAIEDPESEGGRLFRHAISVTANQSGFPVYWGRVIENPEKVITLVVFQNLDARLASRTAEWRKNAIKEIMSLSTQYPAVSHIEFKEYTVPALESPVTTLACAWFEPTEAKAEIRDGFENNFNKYQAHLSLAPGGPKQLSGIFGGWAMENDAPYATYLTGEQRKGKGYFFLSGWRNPDEMIEFHTNEYARSCSVNLMDFVDGWLIQNIQFIRQDVEPNAT